MQGIERVRKESFFSNRKSQRWQGFARTSKNQAYRKTYTNIRVMNSIGVKN